MATSSPQAAKPASTRSPSVRAKIALVLGSCLVALLIVEVALRVLRPELGADLFQTTPLEESPFVYNDVIGYEYKPHAKVQTVDDHGQPTLEAMNSEGFRGPERTLAKPADTYRLLAVGDSVVLGLSTSCTHSWEQVLEDALNQQAGQPGNTKRYEVLNAGIGGYVAWQTSSRLEKHGLKYQPDLVLVHVGWNDLHMTTLSRWQPDLDMSRMDRARAPLPDDAGKGFGANVRRTVLRYSYSARLARQVRNTDRGAISQEQLIQLRQQDSNLPFNTKGLEAYVANLERIHQQVTASGARMALITWSTILAPELLDDPEVHGRLLQVYTSFPLSTRELWTWYNRFLEAQRAFAARHPDLILIDMAKGLAGKDKKERLELFCDLNHYTVEGHRAYAAIVLNTLNQNGVGKRPGQ